MTYMEQARLEHPEWDDDKLALFIDTTCPSDWLTPPDNCYPYEQRNCIKCWNREIPQETKKETRVMNEPIEHTCAECVHQDVCKHMNEFLAAKQKIVDTYVVIGDKTQVKLLSIPCIKAIGLQCKFYTKDVKTR